MVSKDQTSTVVDLPHRPDISREETKMAEQRRPARADPRTGEVPAGPGDAGLQGRPELNEGSPGTEQMSNRRLGVGLGITALLAVLFVVTLLLV